MKTGVIQEVDEACLNGFTESLTNSFNRNDSLRLVDFRTKKRSARGGRNSKASEIINIPETSVLSFKAGKVLKEAVNG